MQLSHLSGPIASSGARVSGAAALRAAVILLALLPPASHAETLAGRVVSIVDGDTLTLADTRNFPHTIRLLGIDAPELAQDYGQAARTTLSALAANQDAAADCRLIDQQLRTLCVVTIGGVDVGLEQIRRGSAWWYPPHNAPLSAKERADYEQAEFMAKIHRLGLWNSKNPTPPRDWRHGRPDE